MIRETNSSSITTVARSRRRIGQKAALAAVAFAAFGASSAMAQLYWDANSALAGNGNWSTSAPNQWSTTNVAGAPNSVWTPNDGSQNAVFLSAAAADNVTLLGGTIKANSIDLQNNINLVGSGSNVMMLSNGNILGGLGAVGTSGVISISNTFTSTISAIITNSGGDVIFTKNDAAASAGTINLNATNTFTGNLYLHVVNTGAGQMRLNLVDPGALPAGVPVNFIEDNIELSFAVPNASGHVGKTLNNNMVMSFFTGSTERAFIAVANANSTVTFSGSITDNGTATELNLGGGAFGSGITVLNPTTSNTYSGNTVIDTSAATTAIGTSNATAATPTAKGWVVLGKNDAISTSSAIIYGRSGAAESTGALDLAGFNQSVTALASGLNNTGTSQGITNSNGASVSTLTITGSSATKYANLIGTPTTGSDSKITNHDTIFTGNVALNLSNTHTGTLALTNPTGNTYHNGTTIHGGALLVGNTSGSATGDGAVSVDSGAFFGGAGASNGAVTVSGTLLPGDFVTNNLTATNTYTGNANSLLGTRTAGTGTLTLRGGLTLNDGSAANFDFSGLQHDQVTTSGGVGASSLAVSGNAGQVAINLNFQGSVINGTYHLFDYTGTTLSAGLFSTFTIGSNNIPAGSAVLQNNAGEVDLTISGNTNALSWNGPAGSSTGTWDTSTPNWLSNGSPTNYSDNQLTFFTDNTANTSATLTVVLSNGGVQFQPLGVVFNNSTSRNYILNANAAGDGIGGTASMTKSGTGTATINTANTFTGATSITGGTLALGANGVLGNTPITISTGGTLSIPKGSGLAGTNDANAPLTLSGGTFAVTGSTSIPSNVNPVISSTSTLSIGSNNVTLAGAVSGSNTNTINLTGSGTLTLGAGAPNYLGGWSWGAGKIIVAAVDANHISGLGNTANFSSNFVRMTSGGTATLQLANVQMGDISGGSNFVVSNSPEIFAGNGSSVIASGTSSLQKITFPLVLEVSGSTPMSLTLGTVGASDSLSIAGSFVQGVFNATGTGQTGMSGTAVHISGPGKVVLQAGFRGASSAATGGNSSRVPAVSWQVDNGILQLGPVVPNTNANANYRGPIEEPLNALGYLAAATGGNDVSDPENPSPVQVNANGILALAVDAPNTNPNIGTASVSNNLTTGLYYTDPPNATPNYLRAPVTLNGGALAATGNEVTYETVAGTNNNEGVANGNLVVARFGGDFNVASVLGGSKILTYNPSNTSEARTVQLVAGSRFLSNATAFYAANSTRFFGTNWNGNLELVAGGSIGGSFDILRDAVGSGTTAGNVSVALGATITIDQNATMNLSGNLDALHDPVSGRNVNIVNNSTTTLNVSTTAVNSSTVIAGNKNIGTLSGNGRTNIIAPSSLTINESAATTYTGTFTGTGALTKTGAGTLALTNLRYNGPVSITAGVVQVVGSSLSTTSTSVLASAPVITGTGQLDLVDNSLIVNYGSQTTGATRDAVRNLLINGRNAPAASPAPWNGLGGITSSYANANGNGFNLAIGYADNAVLAAINASGSYTSFGGQTVASTTILVKMTRGADCNLDGNVDGSDVAIIGTHFNQPGSGQWYFGDFDYSGLCDGNDIAVLGTTFGATSPTLSPAEMTAQFGSAFTAAFESGQAGGAAVPEPASLTLLGLGGLALIGRRRRKASL